MKIMNSSLFLRQMFMPMVFCSENGFRLRNNTHTGLYNIHYKEKKTKNMAGNLQILFRKTFYNCSHMTL